MTTAKIPGIEGIESDASSFEADMGISKEVLLAHAVKREPEPQMVDMSDLGNAVLFCERHGDELRWVREWKKWLWWNGVYWQTVPAEAVSHKYVQPMVREHLLEIGKRITDVDRRKRWLAHVATSNSANRIRAMMELAGPRLMVEVKDLNRNPDLFATRNAVLNLKTCEVVPPDRDDLITVASPVVYDPTATCPVFQQFIEDILVNEDGTPSAEMREYLQRAFGYCLTPDTEEQVFFIGHGQSGENGKTTLMETILAVLGEYGMVGSDTLYFADNKSGGKNSDDLASLYGRRMCLTSETKKSSHFSAAKIKKITGGDSITAMRKFEREFTFPPTHKLFLICNDLPAFDPSDTAMIRRIKLIPFNYQVSEAKKDTKLPQKLKAELPGILNWMLAGLKQWRQGQTLADAHTPAIMQAAKGCYLKDNDDLNEFEERYVEKATEGFITKDDLYAAYRNWAGSAGKVYILGSKTFGQRMASRGWKDARTNTARGWTGYKLKPTAGSTKLNSIIGS